METERRFRIPGFRVAVARPRRNPVASAAVRPGEELLRVVLDAEHLVSVQRFATDQIVVAGFEIEIQEVRIGNEAGLHAAPHGVGGPRLPCLAPVGRRAGQRRQRGAALGERGGAASGHYRIRVRFRRGRIPRRQRQLEPYGQVEQIEEPVELVPGRRRRGRRDLPDRAVEHPRHLVRQQAAALQHRESVPRSLHGAVEPHRRYPARRLEDPVGGHRDRGVIVTPRAGLLGDRVEQLAVDTNAPQALDGQRHVVARRTHRHARGRPALVPATLAAPLLPPQPLGLVLAPARLVYRHAVDADRTPDEETVALVPGVLPAETPQGRSPGAGETQLRLLVEHVLQPDGRVSLALLQHPLHEAVELVVVVIVLGGGRRRTGREQSKDGQGAPRGPAGSLHHGCLRTSIVMRRNRPKVVPPGAPASTSGYCEPRPRPPRRDCIA